MTQLANTFDSADIKGARESLSDLIFNVSPTECPLVSGMKKGKAKAIVEEWQTDTLAAAASNTQIEGDTTSFADPAATTRVHNVLQIMSKATRVSRTVQELDLAGRNDEMALQIAKRGAELKRDLELATLSNLTQVTRSSTVAGVFSGLPAWIATNAPTGSSTAITRNVTGSGAPGGWNGTTTVLAADGTTRAFTNAQLDQAIQNGWTSGAKTEGMKLLMGPKQRSVFSGFDGVAGTVFSDAATKRIMGRADVYASNFGDLMVMNERFIRQTASVDREVFGIDFEYLELAELHPLSVEDIAKTGDAVNKLIVWEGTLKVLNEAALITVADLS